MDKPYFLTTFFKPGTICMRMLFSTLSHGFKGTELSCLSSYLPDPYWVHFSLPSSQKPTTNTKQRTPKGRTWTTSLPFLFTIKPLLADLICWCSFNDHICINGTQFTLPASHYITWAPVPSFQPLIDISSQMCPKLNSSPFRGTSSSCICCFSFSVTQ